MRWPKLVERWTLTTAVRVVLVDGRSESGGPNVVQDISTVCNMQDKQVRVLDSQGGHGVKAVTQLLFDGDIAPGVEKLEGWVLVGAHTAKRHITAGTKARNPDGTVNYTRLELE